MEEILRNFDLVPLDLPMILAGALLFVALWQLLDKEFFGPLKGLVEARENATSGAEHQAKQIIEQSENLIADYNRSIASARAEAARKRFDALSIAKQEASRIVAEAEAEAQEKMRAARAEFSAQASQIRARLDEEAGKLSDDIVRRLLPDSSSSLINSTAFIAFCAAAAAHVLVSPESALAAGGHGSHAPASFGEYLSGLWVYWFNFLLFTGVLAALLKKPIARAWLGRIESIQDAVENAKRELDSAKRYLSQTESRLAGLPKDIQAVLQEAALETEAEGRRIAADAHERANRIRSSSELSIKAESRMVERALQRELAALAFEKASNKLKQLVTPDVDRVLRNQCLSKVGELSKTSGVETVH